MTQGASDPGAASGSETLLPIRKVSAVTGVNSITLRAWERRYSLVSPRRTQTGHRLYSQRDVDRIAQAVALIETGLSISQVCEMIKRKAAAATMTKPSGIWQVCGRRLHTATARMSEADLNDLLQQILARYPMHVVIDQLVLPALDRFRRETDDASVAAASFLAMYMRNKLGARFHHRKHDACGPVLLGIPAGGGRSEIALLAFGLAAHEAGFRPVLTGAETLPGALAQCIKASQADGVVLAMHCTDHDEIESRIARLKPQADVPVLAFGAGVARHRSDLEAVGVIPLANSLSASLETIRQTVNPVAPPPRAIGVQ